MLKNSKICLFLLFFLYSNAICASKSASYLISQTAFNNYDYNQVLSEYRNAPKEDFEDDYLDELISAIIIEDIKLAQNISKKIMLIDPNNQEAKLVSMVVALNNGKTNELEDLRFEENNTKNDLFEFLFFLNDKIKKKIDVSNSFLEVVKSSYSKNTIVGNDYYQNYNFLLFYTSLSILIDNQNYKAILIKGQLLQMINDYFFAESTYLKIPENNDFFIDAQRNIAFNYSQENGFDDVENKIISIVKKNNEDYEIKKLLADFYRIEKKYNFAIKIYSELIEKNPIDLWNIYYLRGICYEQSDNWGKAELDFLQSLKINRNSPNVLNYLAYGWIERDIKIDESFVMLVDAYDANPDSHYILDSLAWAYFKKKDYVKAAELMEEVIDMVPGEAISLDHLADIYFAMNRKREAVYFWRQAMDLAKPKDEIITKIKNKLREHNAS